MQKTMYDSLLVLLSLFYVNLFKELFLFACRFLSESECKGNAFSDTLQTFHDLFSKKMQLARLC
jgi:hypothetical protein